MKGMVNAFCQGQCQMNTACVSCYSEMTAQEVITALLKKFKVVDDPRKFALYERQVQPGLESSKGNFLLITKLLFTLRKWEKSFIFLKF